MKNIREIGSYEIVLYDKDDKRIAEYVVNSSYHNTLAQVNELQKKHNAESFTVSRIMFNSRYNKWRSTSEQT